MWSTVLLQKLFTIARSVVALDWSKVQVVSSKHGEYSLVKQLCGCAASSGTFITAESHVHICHYAPKKRFVPYPDQGDTGINRPDQHYFWWFSVHQDFSLWNLPAPSAIKSSSQERFYYPFVSFKDTDPVAPQSHCFVLYSVSRVLTEKGSGQASFWLPALAMKWFSSTGGSALFWCLLICSVIFVYSIRIHSYYKKCSIRIQCMSHCCVDSQDPFIRKTVCHGSFLADWRNML